MVFTNKKTILIVAGEESGDLHGSSLVGEMDQRMPELSFFGIGGDRLQDGGVETIEHTDNMAVMGFSEVVSKYRFLRKVFQNIVKEIDRRNPERAILIDYPGFNLRLAKKLKERGIPVTYFISPQVWAWKEKRVEVIRKCVDQLICIFPFEEAWYAKRGADAIFVQSWCTTSVCRGSRQLWVPTSSGAGRCPSGARFGQAGRGGSLCDGRIQPRQKHAC